jgi:hypothetical protein
MLPCADKLPTAMLVQPTVLFAGHTPVQHSQPLAAACSDRTLSDNAAPHQLACLLLLLLLLLRLLSSSHYSLTQHSRPSLTLPPKHWTAAQPRPFELPRMHARSTMLPC